MVTVLEQLKDERVLAGLTAVTVALSVKLYQKKSRRPPGPTVWPVVGTLPCNNLIHLLNAILRED